MPTLKEFFGPQLVEGPLDPRFAPPPEVPVEADPAASADPAAEVPMDPMMTQNVVPDEQLDAFLKNAESVIGNMQLDAIGFDPSALDQFAENMDGFVYQLYGQVPDPGTRQKFKSEYQKIAADWATDLTKLFEKLLKLQKLTSHNVA